MIAKSATKIQITISGTSVVGLDLSQGNKSRFERKPALRVNGKTVDDNFPVKVWSVNTTGGRLRLRSIGLA